MCGVLGTNIPIIIFDNFLHQFTQKDVNFEIQFPQAIVQTFLFITFGEKSGKSNSANELNLRDATMTHPETDLFKKPSFVEHHLSNISRESTLFGFWAFKIKSWPPR